MAFCINKKSVEYQTLLLRSGLPEVYVSAVCGNFLEKYDRFPHLDELRGSDSSKYIEEQLLIKDGFATVNNILNMSGAPTVQQALINLNNIFRDTEIEFMPFGNIAKVYMTKRPETKPIENPITDHSEDINNELLFEEIINKLRNLYGINIHEVLGEPELAYIQDGEIYINTELADIDAPIHEMMHLLVGELRFNNPDLYYLLVNNISNLPIMLAYIDNFPNRTRNDIAEEAFVDQFGKMITTGVSEYIPKEVQYELMYNAKRLLDSILMGECSVKDYDSRIFNSSLRELCNMVNSDLDVNKFHTNLGEVHRKLSNIKLELMENSELLEECNG